MRWLYRPARPLPTNVERCGRTLWRLEWPIRSERRFQPEPQGAESSLRLAIASDVLSDAYGLIQMRLQLIVIGS